MVVEWTDFLERDVYDYLTLYVVSAKPPDCKGSTQLFSLHWIPIISRACQSKQACRLWESMFSLIYWKLLSDNICKWEKILRKKMKGILVGTVERCMKWSIMLSAAIVSPMTTLSNLLTSYLNVSQDGSHGLATDCMHTQAIKFLNSHPLFDTAWLSEVFIDLNLTHRPLCERCYKSHTAAVLPHIHIALLAITCQCRSFQQ